MLYIEQYIKTYQRADDSVAGFHAKQEARREIQKHIDKLKLFAAHKPFTLAASNINSRISELEAILS